MRHRLLDDSGQINFVKIFLALLVGGGLYMAWVYAPAYIDYFGMRKAVRVACNVVYTNRSADAARDSLMRSWKEMDPQESVLNPDGSITKKPVVFDPSENADIEVTDPKAPDPHVTIHVHYTEHLVFPFIKKEKDTEWEYTHTEDLTTIKW